MKHNKRKLKKSYQQSTRPMGVFLIRNNLTDKIFLGAGLDLPGIMNRHKFQLQRGIPNKSLQDDWNNLGSNNFAFEIIDELTSRDGVELNYREELNFLEKLWLEKLQPFGERGYNLQKPSQAKMLRRISLNQNRER